MSAQSSDGGIPSMAKTSQSAQSLNTDRRRPPYFRMTGRNTQRHRQPLYGVTWSPDVYVDHDGIEYQYVITCGHDTITLYQVDKSDPKGSFEAKQTYRDADKGEQFYACVFGGRSKRTDPSPDSTTGDATSGGNSDGVSRYATENEVNRQQNGFRKRPRPGDDSTSLILQNEDTMKSNYLTENADQSRISSPQLFCVAGASAVIKVVDPMLKQQVCSLRGHGSDIYDLKVSPADEMLLLSASVDESIRLWNLDSFACVAIFGGLHGHREAVLSVSWHPLGNKFASSGIDKSIRLWSVDEERVSEALHASQRATASEERLSFHPANMQFPYFATDKVHVNFVDCVQFLGDLVLSKSTYNAIVMWAPIVPAGSTTRTAAAYSPPSGVTILRTFELHHCDIWFVRFNIDLAGKLLAVGNIEGEVEVWDIDACEKRASQKLRPIIKSTIRTLAFSPDGKSLVSCCDSGAVFKWNDW